MPKRRADRMSTLLSRRYETEPEREARATVNRLVPTATLWSRPKKMIRSGATINPPPEPIRTP